MNRQENKSRDEKFEEYLRTRDILARHAFEDCVTTHGMKREEAWAHVDRMMAHYPKFQG